MIGKFLNKIEEKIILWNHNYLLNQYKKYKNNASNEKCSFLIDKYIENDLYFMLSYDLAIEFEKTNNTNKRYKLRVYTQGVEDDPIVCFDSKYFSQDSVTGWSVLDYTAREVYDMLLKIRDILRVENVKSKLQKELNNK